MSSAEITCSCNPSVTKCGSALFREVDEDEEAAPWKEQEHWETDQIKKASMHVGARDQKASAQEYEFVFDDQIDFIKDMALAGDVVRCCAAPICQNPQAFPKSGC